MSWETIESMPRGRPVQIGNQHWTALATRKLETSIDAEWIDVQGEEIHWEETTATHWREYEAPPATS